MRYDDDAPETLFEYGIRGLSLREAIDLGAREQLDPVEALRVYRMRIRSRDDRVACARLRIATNPNFFKPLGG